MGRLVVTGVTVPHYGVEGKHAVLYCRSYIYIIIDNGGLHVFLFQDSPKTFQTHLFCAVITRTLQSTLSVGTRMGKSFTGGHISSTG